MKECSDMKNIIFIGMPAAGKSTIGVIAAKRLGYRFIDADILIQEKEGKLLREIIVVNAEIDTENSVIAPGGSVVYCENAMKHYKEIGTVVYLQISFDIINSRLKNAKNRGVVLKEGQTFKELYEERTVLFEKYADVTICEDGLGLEETADRVVDRLRGLL